MRENGSFSGRWSLMPASASITGARSWVIRRLLAVISFREGRVVDYVNPDGTPWTPAFEGQRPPFQPGNNLALTHGVNVPSRVEPIAHKYLAEVQTDPSVAYLQQPRFQASLWMWALAMAKVEMLQDWIADMPIDKAADSNRGKVSPLELLRKWSATAQTQSARLGLDPLSAARLGKDIAQGRQADAASELTRLRAQHEQANSSDQTATDNET